MILEAWYQQIPDVSNHVLRGYYSYNYQTSNLS